MARVKRALPRNPSSDEATPVRRSGRNRAVVRPSVSSQNPEVVELEDASIPPLRRVPFKKVSPKKTEKGESSAAEKPTNAPEQTPVSDKLQEDQSQNLAIVPYANPHSVTTTKEKVSLSKPNDDQNTSCSETNPDKVIGSTRINVTLFEPPEFAWPFEPPNSTSNIQTSTTKSTEVDEHMEMENPQANYTVQESPNRGLPNLNDSIWSDEDEPLIERVEPRKRKYLGQAQAKRVMETEPLGKRLRRMTEEGEPSHTQPLETNCYAAASVQHEQSVKKRVEHERLAKFVKRPNRPHKGFSSSAAAKIWPKFQGRIGLPDKGFDEQSIREFHFIKQVVETQGLEKLCQIHSSYNLSLIREFYCEVHTNSSSRLTIRGVPVHLTAKRINTFLSLTPPVKTEYQKMLKKATLDDLNEVAAALGKPRTSWEYHSNIMLRTFRASNLSADANVWINLVRHSIAPTTHDSTINVERMFLLFCIMTGKTVNVGKQILKSIRESATRMKGKFYFPGMMTKLLVEMGVPQYKDDLIVKEQREKAEIDMKAVQRLRDRKEKGVGALDMVTMMQDVLSQNSTLLDTMLKQRNEFIEKLEELRLEVKAMAAEKRQKEREKAGVGLPKMRRLLRAKNLEIDGLKKQNRKLKAMAAAKTGAAASKAAGTHGTTTGGWGQPTHTE